MNNVEALGVKVDRLSDEWARYRGFVGGVMLVVTSVSAFFAAGLRGWFMGHWR